MCCEVGEVATLLPVGVLYVIFACHGSMENAIH